MKKFSLPVRIASAIGFVVVMGSMAIHNTVDRNDRDYQLHPVASIFGSVLPSLLGGAGIFWWSGRGFRWRRRTRTCPHCAEKVDETATVCKHCGRDIPLSADEHSETAGLPLKGKASGSESTTVTNDWGMRAPPSKTAGVVVVIVMVAGVVFGVIYSRPEKEPVNYLSEKKSVRLVPISETPPQKKTGPIDDLVPVVRWIPDPLQTAYRDADGTWWALLNDGRWYYMVTARREASGKVWVQVKSNETYSVLPPFASVNELQWK